MLVERIRSLLEELGADLAEPSDIALGLGNLRAVPRHSSKPSTSSSRSTIGSSAIFT